MAVGSIESDSINKNNNKYMIFFKKKEKTAEQKIKRAKLLFKVRLVSMYTIGALGGGSWVYSSIEGMRIFSEKTTVVIERVKAAEIETPAKEEAPIKEEVVEVKPVDLVDFIFMKESSRGKNNYSKCEAIGKYNRYGYGIPGNGQYICFEKDEDTKAVAGWVAEKIARGYSDNELLCLYNTGKASRTCGYIE